MGLLDFPTKGFQVLHTTASITCKMNLFFFRDNISSPASHILVINQDTFGHKFCNNVGQYYANEMHQILIV